jgi:thiamine-phosphate pyrophosphorylase
MFFTDPERTPQPWRQAAALPRGSAVVFRAFGAPDAVAQGLRLRAAGRRRGLMLLAGADSRLSAAIGADGVHLPERLAHRARRLSARRGWLVTVAAHTPRAAFRAQRLGAEAVVVSAIFPSRSPSAGKPWGVLKLAKLARRLSVPVYALGGINDATARRLLHTGVAGLAAVEGFSPRT